MQMMLGSVTAGVVAAAPCPVLVVRDPAPEAIDHILVEVTRAAPSQRAVEAAISLARACAARLTLLHVIDTALLASAPRAASMLLLRRSVESDGAAALDRLSHVCRTSGVEADALQATGQAADVLLALAQERGAQVVAIGRPGRPGLERLVLGGESDAILRRAETAVLITGEESRVAEPRSERDPAAQCPPRRGNTRPAARHGSATARAAPGPTTPGTRPAPRGPARRRAPRGRRRARASRPRPGR
jgi:nucleotide-binding universal stress UspA family protein